MRQSAPGLSPLSLLVNCLPCSSICFDLLVLCSSSLSARSRRLCIVYIVVVFTSSTSSPSYRHHHCFALVIVALSTSSSTRPHRYIDPVSIVFVAFVCTCTLVLCSVWSTVTIVPLQKPQTFSSCRPVRLTHSGSLGVCDCSTLWVESQWFSKPKFRVPCQKPVHPVLANLSTSEVMCNLLDP